MLHVQQGARGWVGWRAALLRALLSLRPVSLCSALVPQPRAPPPSLSRRLAEPGGAEPGAFARASRRRNAGASVTCVGRSSVTPGVRRWGERDRVVKARADHTRPVGADRGAHVQALPGNG